MERKKNENLFRLTLPIFIEMLLTVLVGNVSQFMLSSYSQEAVAAVGNANQILNVLILLFSVINLSTVILSSQYIGSFQKNRAKTVYNLSILINLIFSLFVSAVVFIYAKEIFTFMKVPETSLNYAITFISIVGGFIFLQGMNSIFSTILRTQKLMGKAMLVSVLINVVNILGNALLINGPGPFPRWGVAGSAIATVLSRLGGMVAYILILYKYTDVRFKIKYLKPFPGKELKKMLGIGLPSAGENISYSLSQTTILRIVNQFGVFIINTRAYVIAYQWISVIYSAALSQVAQILVGRALGERDTDGANQRIKKTLIFSVIMAIVMSTFVYLFSEPLISLFTKEKEILVLAKKIMFIEIFLQIGKCSNVTLVRCLQATGDTKFPVAVGITIMWIVAVGLGYVLGVVCHMGLVGIWIAMATDELVRSVIFFVRWRSGVWKKFNLVD